MLPYVLHREAKNPVILILHGTPTQSGYGRLFRVSDFVPVDRSPFSWVFMFWTSLEFSAWCLEFPEPHARAFVLVDTLVVWSLYLVSW